MALTKYKTFLAETRATKQVLSQQVASIQAELLQLKTRLGNLITAQDVMNTVSVLAQTEFKGVVEALVTEALHYVFGDNYSFEIESTVARNQAEAQMWVVIDGVRHSLKDELGGGVVDVCSFVLKVTFWALQINRTEPVLIFDEPLKNIDSGRLEAIGVMIKSLSDRLGVQYIIVTHEQELAEIADVSYRVIITDGISTVERLK